MNRVYLGLFSWIFDKIWNSILKPVIEFIGGLLNSVLSVLFDKVLMPLLINVFFPMFKSVCKFAFDIICGVLFRIYVTILHFVDILANIFNIFGGIQNVTYKKNEMSILIALLNMTPVMRMVWMLAGLSFALLIFFSIISVIRSIGELGDEVKMPVSKVMRHTWDGFIKMFSAPLTCLLLILLMQTVLSAVHAGLSNGAVVAGTDNKGTQTTIGRAIFVVSTLDAANNEAYNITTAGKAMQKKLGINDDVRARFYYTDYKENGKNASLDYTNLDIVDDYFNYKNIDYLIGGAMALLFAFTLARGALTFIGRLFNVIILTIISPLFGGTIPLDEGKMYEKWRDMYVGQLFSGFGLVMAMEIYMMMVPIFMNGGLAFGTGTVEANYMIRIIFLAAGAYMVQETGPIITGFVSQAAASAEMNSNRVFGGQVMMAASYAQGKMVKGAKSLFNKAKGGGKKDGKGDDKSNKSDAKPDGKGTSAKADAAKAYSDRVKDTAEQNKLAKVKAIDETTKEEDAKKPEAGVRKSYLGGMFVKGVGKDGKEHWGVNLGSKFNFGLKSDGSVSGNVFGIGWKKGKDGKIDKVSVPFMRFKRGDDGKMHLSKVKISKGMQLRRAEEVTKDANGNVVSRKLGGMYCSDLSAIGMKRRYDASTGKVETQSMLGTHYRREVGADGKAEYVKSHRNFLGTTSVYSRDKAGNYHVTARKGFTSDRTYDLDEDTGQTTLKKASSFGGKKLFERGGDDDDDDDDGDDEE